MYLKFVPTMSQDDREKLRPKKGDTVLFEGAKYVVTDVGLKYVHMHPEGNPNAAYIAKVTEISKYFPPEDDDEEESFELPT
jgi:hypothetical protein